MKGLLFIIFFSTTFSCVAKNPLAYTYRNESIYISVKDFGAKGDGKTDDTQAIQEAINYAQELGFSRQTIPDVYEKRTIYFGATKTLFFPTGIYVITTPLKVGSYLHFIGEKAVLVPSKLKTNIIDAIQATAWQANIEGLQFIGFDTALKLDNNNVNLGKIVIENCDFLDNQTAIELSARSSISIIRENRFYNNLKVLNILEGDKVDMYDNWITAAPLTGVYDAQIINRGVLHFDKNLLVPVPPKADSKEPAWINNYGIVTIDAVRQGGESGSFTLVNNFAKADITYPVTPNAVVITNSDCYAVFGNKSGYYQPAVLRLISVPNNIVLQNLRGIVDAKLMDFTQFKTISKEMLDLYNSKQIMVKVDNIQNPPMKHNNGMDVPNNLLKFLVK